MTKEISYKEELMAQLEQTTSRLLQLVEAFGQQEINDIPFEGSWTAAQVADHITKSNSSIAKALTLKGSEINRDPGERIQELKEIFLDFNTRLKSPNFILPSQDIYEREIVIRELGESVERVKEIAREQDLSEMISHPAFGDITKYEILHFVLYHTQRHIHQLEKTYDRIMN